MIHLRYAVYGVGLGLAITCEEALGWVGRRF